MPEQAEPPQNQITLGAFFSALGAGLDAGLKGIAEAMQRTRLQFLEAAVEEYGLRGHAQGVDHDLAQRQLGALLGGTVLGNIELAQAALAAIEELVHHWPEFMSGERKVAITAPELGYAGELGWDDFKAALAAVAPGVDPAALLPAGLTPEQLLETEPGDWYLQLKDTLVHHLGQQGLVKGPCIKCGRAAWVVKYRPKPKRGGRPPLEWEYCPACRVARERARDTANMRRYREKQSAMGDPDESV